MKLGSKCGFAAIYYAFTDSHDNFRKLDLRKWFFPFTVWRPGSPLEGRTMISPSKTRSLMVTTSLLLPISNQFLASKVFVESLPFNRLVVFGENPELPKSSTDYMRIMIMCETFLQNFQLAHPRTVLPWPRLSGPRTATSVRVTRLAAGWMTCNQWSFPHSLACMACTRLAPVSVSDELKLLESGEDSLELGESEIHESTY